MKFRQTIIGIVLGAAAALIGSHALSQDQPGQQTGGPSLEDLKAMMEKWEKSMKPGPEHALLAKMAGEWTYTQKMWWEGPNAPPMECKGEISSEMILGGRFLLQRYKGVIPMPDAEGNIADTPWEAIQLSGYDNFRKSYVQAWADSAGTMLLTMTGTSVPGSSAITTYGQMDEPMMDMVARHVKGVTGLKDDNTIHFEMFDLAVADNYKVVEVTATRKK